MGPFDREEVDFVRTEVNAELCKTQPQFAVLGGSLRQAYDIVSA